MIQVNGKKLDINEITICKLLEENGYWSQRVAVEVNYEIIPRSQHNDYILHSGDVVEIVSFVGGGWKNIFIQKQ